MGFIDTHAHIDGEEFDLDRDEMIARARESGAEAILVPAINMGGLEKLRSVVKSYPGFAYAMIGLHPEDVRPDWREVVDGMRRIYEESPTEFIAIGEIGLDFYWSREYEREQMECFEEQVRWAVEARLPLVIHCRKAQNELVAILKKYRAQLCGGVFHCFAGNEKEAAELLAFDGFLIGVGGVLTFKKSHLPEVLPSIPLDRLVCETDAPYMAPVPMRGKRNESAFIPYIIERMAEAYSTTADEVARRTTANARRLFKKTAMTLALMLTALTANAAADDDGILPCRGCHISRQQPSAAITRVRSNPPSTIAQQGKKKQLVLLMQYPDKLFLNPDPQAYWHNALNTGNIDDPRAIGSLHQYFLDQSNGIFDVDFDVRGPFTAKNNMEYYGKDVYMSKYAEDFDQHPDELVIEGCEALKGTVDFADYDWDGDGEIEQIIVIFAGNGQNDSKATDRAVTIWPHTCEITEFKSSKPIVQDGITINTYSIANDEFRGSCDGFGVTAHEYSHCLGLPDFYSTGSSHGKDNFGKYDVMHSAYFTDQMWVPAGYTAYEKEFMGWTTIEELTQPTTVSGLNSLANGGKAYMIRNNAKSTSADEYYLIENRRREGWDKYIPGEGLLVTHYDYNATIWKNNIVNTVATHQRAVIIPANSNSTASYPYPYVTTGIDGKEVIVNDCLTDDSQPAASVFNQNVNGTNLMGKPLTNIRRDAEGLISFDFMGGTADIRGIMADGAPSDLEYFDLQGRKVSVPSRGIYIIRNKKTSKTYKSSFN